MTKKEAKKLSLEIWGYLKDHPEISTKEDLPENLMNKITNFDFYCPLCDFYHTYDNENRLHKGCPLISCFEGSDYFLWNRSTNATLRRKYATNIYEAIKSWKV